MTSPTTTTIETSPAIDAGYVLRTALEGFIAIDRSGAVIAWNGGAEATYGWRADEVMGRELASITVPPEHRLRFRTEIDRAMSTGVSYLLEQRLELPAIHRSGRHLMVEVTIAEGSGHDGVGLFGFVHDVTGRRQDAQVTRARAAVFEALAVAALADVPKRVLAALCRAGGWCYGGWWETSPAQDELHDYVSWTSPVADLSEFVSMTRMMRFSRGQGLPGLVWSTGTPQAPLDMRTVMRTRRIAVAKHCGLHRSVGIPLLAGGAVVGVLEFFDDVAGPVPQDRIDLLMEATAPVGEYLASRRAEQRTTEMQDSFVATVSHELRTPLTSITGFARTMLDFDDITPEERRSFLEIIEQQAQRLARLVEDLLDMARIQTGLVRTTLVPVDVGELVHEALRLRGGQDVDLGDAPRAVMALADADAVVQIITNLLDNADRYGGGATAVELRTRRDDVELAVIDDGDGVPEHFRERLFDRFARASKAPDIPGTGLGLSIVRALAELMGGHAWYQPREPRGSRFVVTLRRAPDEPDERELATDLRDD